VLHDGCVVVHRLGSGPDPLGVDTGQHVQSAKVLAVVKSVEVEHCGAEGWECVIHGVEVSIGGGVRISPSS